MSTQPTVHTANATNGATAVNIIPDTASSSTPLCYCAAEGSRKTLAFHVATLAPLIATYAAVLKYACAKLADGVMLSRAQFSSEALRWLREAKGSSTSAVGAVPSQLLVQHAVEALVEEGCLIALDEGVPLPPTSTIASQNCFANSVFCVVLGADAGSNLRCLKSEQQCFPILKSSLRCRVDSTWGESGPVSIYHKPGHP